MLTKCGFSLQNRSWSRSWRISWK